MTDSQTKETVIGNRKDDHLTVAVTASVEQADLSNFTNIQLEHNALPELSLTQIDSSIRFLGKKISMPLMISSTTGGTPSTHTVLRQLAEAAELNKIALCVGSQRIALEFPECEKHFHLRDVAPTIPLLANLGAVQLNYGLNTEHCLKAIDMLDADGFVLHLNPLQECLQAGGNTDFRNLLNKIETLARNLPIPLIVKEVGCGISLSTAKKLIDAGVSAIDVSGSGGTSWALMEAEMTATNQRQELASSFAAWGSSTVSLLEQYKDWNYPGKWIIASGGVRSGIDIAKSIALGASMTGIALPFVKAAAKGPDAIISYMDKLRSELLISMFCTGSGSIAALSGAKVVKTGFHSTCAGL